MMRCFYNGVCGVKTHSFGMDILANNISNINTVGYRAAIPEFKDLLYQSSFESGVNLPANQVGLAATGVSTAFSQKQGSLQITDRELDVALQGRGFFGIRDIDGKDYFTRNGQFGTDATGTLVDSFGRRVLGTMNPGFKNASMPAELAQILGANGAGATVSPLLDIRLAPVEQQGEIKLPKNLFSPHVPTSEVKFRANLDASISEVHKNIALDDLTLKTPEEAAADGNMSGKFILSARHELALAGSSVIFSIDRGHGMERIAATVGDDGVAQIELDAEPASFSALLSTKVSQSATNTFSSKIIDENGLKRDLVIELKAQLPGLSAEFGGRPENAAEQIEGGKMFNAVAKILGAKGEVLSEASGEVGFNYDGSLALNTLGKIGQIALDFGPAKRKTPPAEAAGGDGEAGAGGAAAGGAAAADRGDGAEFSGLVCYEGGEQVERKVSANGDVAGLLRGYQVDDFGNILAAFTNGKSAAVAKLAVFQFINEQGLEKRGDNEYAATTNSKKPMFFTGPDGEVINPAKIEGQMLEMSNTDLGTELTHMIAFQKAYEASAKSISTADQMIKRAIEMKK